MQRVAPVPRASEITDAWTSRAPSRQRGGPARRTYDDCAVRRRTAGTPSSGACVARCCGAAGSANQFTSSRGRHDHHRRRAAVCSRRRRRVRGLAHRGGGARGARRPGRTSSRIENDPRLSQRRLRRRTCEPRAPAGKAARSGKILVMMLVAGIDAATRQVCLDGGEPILGGRSSCDRVTRCVRPLMASTGRSARASTMARRAAKKCHPRTRRRPDRRRKLGGPGRLVSANHARR